MASYYDPNKRPGLIQRVFFGGYDEPNQTLRWTIECADGRHSIGLRVGSDIRMTKSIYIDGDYITNITYKGRKFLPEDTYDFDCYGEQVKLVFYRNKVYLVHRGIVHGTQVQYKPERQFPFFVKILLTIITLASVGVSLLIGNAVGGASIVYVTLVVAIWIPLALAGMVFNAAGNPIYTTPRRLFIIICLTLAAWVIAFCIPFLVVKLVETWKNE